MEQVARGPTAVLNPAAMGSTTRYDAAVVGQGLIGLSTTLALARRGLSVVALDALGPGHPLTSSAGASRSIRTAYAEPVYVRLALEAIAAWRRLEAETGRTILHLTGQVDLGPAGVLEAIAAAMGTEGVPVRRLDEDGVADVFPELRLGAGEAALFHENAGTVLAAEAMAALAEAAARAGAELAAPEPVERVELEVSEARLATPARQLRAARVVVAAGPWSGGLLAELGVVLPLSPAVAQVTYVDVPAFVGRPGIAEWSAEEDGRGVYGHPVPGVGYKFAFDAAGQEVWSPSATAWEPDPGEQAELEEWIGSRFPGTVAPVVESQRHPWTMTPDADFVIDTDGPLVVACGCSGHAFKFGPALGELIAGVAVAEPSPDAAMFSMRRPAMSQAPVSANTPITR